MKTEALLKDPVFQLNLLLWMAKEQPKENFRVRPFFYEQHYEIIYIEQPFDFPEKTHRVISAFDKEISVIPEPDLILGHESESKALYFEAKADSFGCESSNCKQARGHLLATGTAFGEVYPPLKDCLLCYVLPADKTDIMSKCLSSLKEDLRKGGLQPGKFSVHGLSVNGTSMYYSWDDYFKKHTGVWEENIEILTDLDADTDPSPLLLVFSDEDCANIEIRDFYRRILLEQVRSSLLCDLHNNSVGVLYLTTPEKLLMATSKGVYQYLGRKRQNNLHNLILHNVFKHMFSYWEKKQPGFNLDGDTLTITWDTQGEKEEFLNWLEDRRMNFDTSKPPKPPEEQLSLFNGVREDNLYGPE